MSFLPDSYEAPKAGGGFLKLQQGDNKLRILSAPIIGWIDWKDKKPYRFAYDKKPLKALTPDQDVKQFWALIVLDILDQQIKILEITQTMIMGALSDLARNPEWGNPVDYGITINKSGSDKQTKYTVLPSPKKPLTEDHKALALAKPINLEAMFTGGDPYAATNGEQTQLLFQELPF